MAEPKLHIAMFPWFAFGHMNPFLLLSNELAKRGHKVSFLTPNKAITQLQPLNLHPSLITFYHITVTHVDPLPVGFKTVFYTVVSASSVPIALLPGRKVPKDGPMTMDKLAEVPRGYPSKTAVYCGREAKAGGFASQEFGRGTTFEERIITAISHCDAIGIRTCHELEGELCDYIAARYQKPGLLSGPILPEPSQSPPEDKWARWLGKFEPGSVIFCALGSQWILEQDQLQELVLGLELTQLPFLVAVKPPVGASSVDEALPEGFKERVGDRGLVYGGWVPQVQILNHRSVGCFVSHCGFGSMWESLMCESQIVLVPHLGDQILNTRFMADELKVAIEVERDENGCFSKEGLCKAVKSAMDRDSEPGGSIRANHTKWRKTLLSQGFMSNYIDKFIQNLHELI